MTISRSEDLFVGIVALAIVPWTIGTIVRGLRAGRLPIGRGHVERARPAAFNTLLASYALATLLCAIVAADLLFKLGIRSAS